MNDDLAKHLFDNNLTSSGKKRTYTCREAAFEIAINGVTEHPKGVEPVDKAISLKV